MHGRMSNAPRIMVVTASDARFMPFVDGMLASISSHLARPNVSAACFDIGLSAADRQSLNARGIQTVAPRAHLGVDEAATRPALLSFLARPFLPEYFPGHDVYLWIDSDVWLQDPAVFDDYVGGALTDGMAITHERTPAYRFQPWLLGWTGKHFLRGYGAVDTSWLLLQRHVNAGFFAIRANAPHWQAWASCYQAAIARTGDLVPHDQFALNHALHGSALARGKLTTRFLPPRCNWICDRGIPMWNDDAHAFCEPRAPYTPIGALHLAGPAKVSTYTIGRTGGGSFETCLVYGASPETPMCSPLKATLKAA